MKTSVGLHAEQHSLHRLHGTVHACVLGLQGSETAHWILQVTHSMNYVDTNDLKGWAGLCEVDCSRFQRMYYYGHNEWVRWLLIMTRW
mmetsp:Transcript_45323/g.75210  ORF Transcript_45323/g.75210 Transcript_45323/m.75210 type:complete len:88 (+) Transcript_45323:872-1135(+)